jgi:hypothetical protein
MSNLLNIVLPQIVSIGLMVSLVDTCTSSHSRESYSVRDVFHHEDDLNYANAEDDRFLVYAAEVSHEFILLGELARQNGMKEVKELGRVIEEGHRKILNELTVLARKQLVTIPLEPSHESMATYDQMKLLKNELFDAAFCMKQTEILDQLIRKYEAIEEHSGDMILKNWAFDQLYPLRSQFIHLMGCKQKFEKI